VNRIPFDPFRDRLARDIRNSMSKSFLHSLAERDISHFQECVAKYLQQHLETAYEAYLTKRLEKYEKAFSAIAGFESREVLQQAAILWDLELFYEMHELLEPLWKEAEGGRRRALQGLIRAAGMKIHAENNNFKAASSMGAKALADLLTYGNELESFDRLEAVLAELEQASPSAEGTIQN